MTRPLGECTHRLYGVCPKCKARDLAERTPRDIDWFHRTEQCGYCGNPGTFCICTEADPCGCRDLHDMGSASLPDALEAFMPNVVHVEQAELFGDAS